VKYIALIQDGREDVRPLAVAFRSLGHLRRELSPLHVEGRDADGEVLARISDEL